MADIEWNEDHKKKRVGVTRRKCDELLTAVCQRAKEIERDPGLLYAVAKIAVFGSYVNTTKDKLGDLDIAVALVAKEPNLDKLNVARERQSRREANPNGSFIHQLFYPEQKVYRALKQRSAALSITFWSDLERIAEHAGATYRVIYRSPRYEARWNAETTLQKALRRNGEGSPIRGHGGKNAGVGVPTPR